MKETWISASNTIIEELQRIISEQKTLTLYMKGGRKEKITLKKIWEKDDAKFLIFQKEMPFAITSPEDFLIVYKYENTPLYGFQCVIRNDHDSIFAAHLPKEIFQLQRRRHQRIRTPERSTASILFKHKSRVFLANVQDICQEGSRLSGEFKTFIQTRDQITPLGLSLFLRHARTESALIHIPEADVIRVSNNRDQTKDVAVQFKLSGAPLKSLQNFISQRITEDAP